MSPIISFWIAIISFLIAVISFAWGIYVYFRHENKLKKQECIINDFTIKKNREEEENKKKAILGLKGIKKEDNKRFIRVYNNGLAEGRNVNVSIDDIDEHIMPRPPMDIPLLNPNENFEIFCLTTTQRKDRYRCTITWDDDFSEKRSTVSYLTF